MQIKKVRFSSKSKQTWIKTLRVWLSFSLEFQNLAFANFFLVTSLVLRNSYCVGGMS